MKIFLKNYPVKAKNRMLLLIKPPRISSNLNVKSQAFVNATSNLIIENR